MSSKTPADLQPVLSRLEKVYGLTGSEHAAFAQLPCEMIEFRANRDIGREDGPANRCFAVLSGLAAGFKLTRKGRRQIVALHLAGDLVNLRALHFHAADTSVVAVSQSRVAFFAREALLGLCEAHPRFGTVLWRETLVQAASLREWIVNVGQRPGRSRLGHLLCEMLVRSHAAGLAPEHRCSLPLTQQLLGDALGLSAVHVNRTLQELRSEGLISWNGGELTVLNWKRLKVVADFDPSYLHLEDPSGDQVSNATIPLQSSRRAKHA